MIIGEHIATRDNPQLSFEKAPAVPGIDITPIPRNNGQVKYGYNDEKPEIDIIDAINSQLNRETIPHNARTMKPTHKNMCEEFIKEISAKTSTSGKKPDYIKSTKKSKKYLDQHSKKTIAGKLDAKVKKLDKAGNKNTKESIKTKKNKTSDQDKVKRIKASLVDKSAKNEKKPEKEKSHKMIKPFIDVNDLTKQIVSKDTQIKQKTDDLGLARKKLKIVRTISEEPLHSSNSEKCVHSPVKSIVRKTEKCHDNSPKRQCLEINEVFDLRSKLSRANQRMYRKQMENDKSKKEIENENLKISVENQNTVKTKSPKKSNVLKHKTKKCSQLNLIINVMCKKSDDESFSSVSNMNETTPTENIDLSFLDDFNVDEIVDSLRDCPKMDSPIVSKLEDCTEMSKEPQFKPATILNMLQAKSETNKLKKTEKAKQNIEEAVTSNRSIELIQAHAVSDYKIKESVKNTKQEENDLDDKNARHALIKILSQTKSQLDQQRTTPPLDESLVTPCCSDVLDCNNISISNLHKLLKNIVDSALDNNEPENTSKTNQTHLPNSNNIKVEKEPVKILSYQEKALTMRLEKRMLDYLHMDIKVIQHIHYGKFSNIYSCKDSTTGEMYAAKIVKDESNRHTHIHKEKMIRKLQRDIPMENLNTVYLVAGFSIDRNWCFLTEYYPKNLLQVFMNQTEPFHIDLVQDLTRQLISAVMVLRNNDTVHSDIKPSHILVNATHDRLKLCGFDAAYCGHNTYLQPNIGTLCYRAPEIILGYCASYSIDVWALGLVIYEIATNEKLFTGVHNNDILYKQMCTFGNLPWDMVETSPFRNQHFQGHVFMRCVGYNGQDTASHSNFDSTKHALKKLYGKYRITKDTAQRRKTYALYELLNQMLLLDPRLRIPIEFACADPFIHNFAHM